MNLDTDILSNLLSEVEKRGGGFVLNNGKTPVAVVLSVEKYYQLLKGASVLEENLTNMEISKQENLGKVLVTGGAGYIGAHVVRCLLEEGFEVVVVDDLSTGRKEFVPEDVVFYEGSVLDANFLRDVFSQHEFNSVIHLAAKLEVEESVSHPDKYLETNVSGTMKLLGVMNEFGVKKVVFSSTAAVYGEPVKVPIPETAELKPNNPYGHSKMLAEEVLKYFHDTMDFSCTILRYFNVCGVNPAWNIEDTHKNSHLIPVILEVARGERAVFTLNGDDYATVDGSCVRDYVSVWDIARAHVASIKQQVPNKFKVYNVGSGKGVSVKEMISVAAEVTGKMIPMQIGPRRAGDAAVTVADNKLISRELGFSLEHSSLEEVFNSSW